MKFLFYFNMVNVKYFIERKNDKNTLQNCTWRHILKECTEWKCDKLKLKTFNINFLFWAQIEMPQIFFDDFIFYPQFLCHRLWDH